MDKNRSDSKYPCLYETGWILFARIYNLRNWNCTSTSKKRFCWKI